MKKTLIELMLEAVGVFKKLTRFELYHFPDVGNMIIGLVSVLIALYHT